MVFVRLRRFAGLVLAELLGPLLLFLPFSRHQDTSHLKIIVNGVPKSGTHFLVSVVRAVTDMQRLNVHFLTKDYEILCKSGRTFKIPSKARYLVRRLLPGQLVAAHLEYSSRLENAMRGAGLVHLFIYRDPRDAVCSRLSYELSERYAKQTLGKRARQKKMKLLGDDSSRIDLLIGENGPALYDRYEGWLNSDVATPVRFEDLYKEVNAKRVGPELRKVLRSLGKKKCDIQKVYDSLGKSRTYSKGKKIGRYKDVFLNRQKRIYETGDYLRMMRAYGYK